MAEKKIQENPEVETQQAQPTEPVEKQNMQVKTNNEKLPEKSDSVPVVVTTVPVANPPQSSPLPAFMKSSPSEMYRKLLPAVLFLLTFVTVMTMLLIYMDTVALGAQQFRLNMSRDYELARIPQDSAPLVSYVRQLHLSPRRSNVLPMQPVITERVTLLDGIVDQSNGTFVEILASGGRDPSTLYLQTVRGWAGLVARAAPRDYLALRGAGDALHACLSPDAHPREVTYHDTLDASLGAFSSRVLCLPLYTMLLAGECVAADYMLVGGPNTDSALASVPDHAVDIQVIEVRSTDAQIREKSTALLLAKNYTILATFDDGIMFNKKSIDTEAQT